MLMLTWVFLFLWENRKLLKINKVSYQLSRGYLSIKEDNLRFCFYENAKSFIFAGKYL